MIKILICEDIERDKLHLHQLLDSFLQSNNILYKIDYLENFNVGSNLFLEYDLIFLDIELGDYNGIEIASKIRTYNRSSIIIITSSFKKYLIDGYKIEAKRYLIKPIDEKIFNVEMQSVLSTSFKQQYGFFDKKISQYKIHYKDMLYIEFLNRHTIIHFVNNIEKKTTYPLKHWIEKLSNKGFGQPYKSFLVNLDYVSGFSSDGKDIIMNNGEKIPLSKNFKKSFTNQYFANLHNIL